MQGVKMGPHQLLKADKPLELEPIIVEIATANKSQGEYSALSSD